MSRGLYFDGQRARAHSVELSVGDGRLKAVGDDLAFEWPLADIRIIDTGPDRVRLGPPGAGLERLVVDCADWQALTGRSLAAVSREAKRREWKLIAALAAGGAVAALGVFVGIPMAAGPLARVTPPAMEAAIGANIEGQLMLVMRPCEGDREGAQRLDELAGMIAMQSDSVFRIHARAVRAPMVNAFALPGGSILVTDEMIEMARTPEELAGVLAHEIAHVEKRHAMHAAWRSMGVGLVLDAVVGGGTGAGQQAVLLAGGLTEQRFSRELEAEADARALELLSASHISSRGMADLFERMAGRRGDDTIRHVAEWFATHPDSLRRAQRLRSAARPGMEAMSEADWRQLKRVCAVQDKR